MDSEIDKFNRWYEQEKAKGLVDIKFFCGDVSEATSEDFCRAFNVAIAEVQNGKVLPRGDLF